MKGVDLPVVQELLGHRNIGMTLRYAHLSPHYLSEQIKVLDKTFSRKLPFGRINKRQTGST
jgi:site-specific recombinase XerD